METVNFSDYLAATGYGSSFLRTIYAKSPAHAMVEKPSTAAMEKGTATHAYVLEPDTFHDRYIVAKKMDRRTKDGKAAWADLQSLAAETGRTVIAQSDLADVEGMREALMRDPVVRDLFAMDHLVEQSIFWTDAETGLQCKARPDMVIPEHRIILDLKTCQDARPRALTRSIADRGYDMQDAYYSDGMYHDTGERWAFYFLFVESRPPYAHQLVRLTHEDHPEVQSWQAAGREKNEQAIRTVKRCLETGEWPGYGGGVLTISPPEYALPKRKENDDE